SRVSRDFLCFLSLFCCWLPQAVVPILLLLKESRSSVAWSLAKVSLPSSERKWESQNPARALTSPRQKTPRRPEPRTITQKPILCGKSHLERSEGCWRELPFGLVDPLG